VDDALEDEDGHALELRGSTSCLARDDLVPLSSQPALHLQFVLVIPDFEGAHKQDVRCAAQAPPDCRARIAACAYGA
jgi:hypothetical protein